MAFGYSYERPCPECGALWTYTDYRRSPPPIPAGRRTGSYADYNQWSDEDQTLMECPMCDYWLEDADPPEEIGGE